MNGVILLLLKHGWETNTSSLNECNGKQRDDKIFARQ